MKRFMKFAAAAVILLGVFGGLHFFQSGNSSGIVWAEVAQRVRQAAVSYQIHMTIAGEALTGASINSPMNMSAGVWIAPDNRMKMEMNSDGKLANIIYILPDQKKMVSVMPDAKKFMELELTDDLLAKMKQQNQDPREWIQKIVHSQYQSIGKSTIDGIEVEGLESTDPAIAGGMFEKALARLWGDTQTGYPVQMEVEMAFNEGKTQISYVIHDFQWNQDINDNDFTPPIGDDYTAMPKMQMPKVDQQSAIAGLQTYRDITGRYPDNLNLVTLMGSMEKIMKDKTVIAKLIDPNALNAMSQDEKMKWVTDQIMMPIQTIAMFYMNLAQEQQDPAYYGKTVTPGDAQHVLLRWKASNTTYKVIMGDLSVTEMTADQLHQIEPTRDKPQ